MYSLIINLFGLARGLVYAKLDEDCVEEGFQLAREKFGRDGEGAREAIGTGYYSIDI